MSNPGAEINALIQADVDGLISGQERDRLNQYLENGGDARALYEDYRQLTAALDNLVPLEPSAELLPGVMAAIHARPGSRDSVNEATSLYSGWFTLPALRYGLTFLVGVIFSGIILQLNLEGGMNDKAAVLSGTMLPRTEQRFQTSRSMSLDQLGLKGSVELSQNDQLLNLNFALDGDLPAELAITFESRSYKFSGFLLEAGDSPSLDVENDQILLSVNDDQQFSVRLVKVSGPDSALELRLDRGDATEYRMTIHPYELESDY